ncbi:hypothetical protein ABZ369_06510 [Streptomyces sp. NPDC005918]|uniref:hypothetical protein n=1 Tax=Streptomyces sp. NPDC005918 TaxID=3155454 RepID=UPI0033CE0AE8
MSITEGAKPVNTAVVPCGPCLQQLLTADVADLHVCDHGTSLAVEEGDLLVVRETRCPCRCQHASRAEKESTALRAARARARAGARDE